MSAAYLGIDIGTSSVKALLISARGKALGDASAPLSVSRPKPGFSEQDPADWFAATLKAVDRLKREYGAALSAVRGIGLSGQMHGATLLDKAHKVIRPAILWNDTRSAKECAEIEAAFPRSREVAGNIAMPGFTAPKVQWVRNSEKKNYQRIAKVLLPKDYVRFLLSGEFVSEMSDAAGTLWLDVARRDWSDDLLAATGLSRSHMPSLVEGTEVSAELSKKLADRWGMKTQPVIAGGGGDNAASACGIGALSSGEGFVSLGTSGVLFVANEKFSPNTNGAVHAFCHAVPGVWHQMGVILSATDSLNWLAGVTKQMPDRLAEAVADNFEGPGAEIFLPYLSGERTPHNDANARGAFVGLSHLSTPVHLAQAVMEGVAFAVRDCQRVLADAGTRIGTLLAVGGGSKSPLWLKMLAANLNTEILLPQDGDFGAAFGAARLGLCAAEGAKPADIMTMPKIAKRVKPDPRLAEAYAISYARYRALYPAIKGALQ